MQTSAIGRGAGQTCNTVIHSLTISAASTLVTLTPKPQPTAAVRSIAGELDFS